MQTRFFACFYVAGRGLTGRLPAEIVADCRWRRSESGSVGSLFGSFEASFWARQRDSWRSGLSPQHRHGSGWSGFLLAVTKKSQVRASIYLLWLLAGPLPRPSGWRLQNPLRRGCSVGAHCVAELSRSLDQGGAARGRRWLGVSAALSLRRPAQRTPSHSRENPPDQHSSLARQSGSVLLAAFPDRSQLAAASRHRLPRDQMPGSPSPRRTKRVRVLPVPSPAATLLHKERAPGLRDRPGGPSFLHLETSVRRSWSRRTRR
jgi:hypothetical protein